MRVSNHIQIAAAPDAVWAVTMDVERWPEWTPTVTSVRRLDSGPFAVGSAVLVKQPLQPESRWTVTDFVPGRRFAWETRRAGLRMIGIHEIAPAPAGTENTLHLDASGPLAWLLWPVLGPAIRRALAEENRGLKQQCEGSAVS